MGEFQAKVARRAVGNRGLFVDTNGAPGLGLEFKERDAERCRL